MHQNISLEFTVYSRELKTLTNNQLREKQLIPAIVYGHGQKNINLSVDIKSVIKYVKKEYENKIFTFKSNDKTLNNLKVLKKDISYHKVSKKPLHMDFLSLDMSKNVRVNVEINFIGKAKGVKESGGIFNIIRRDIEIECLPAEIPNSFSIDISSLDINQNFHVADLKIPTTAKLITSPKESLCAVNEMEQEEETKTTSVSADSANKTEDTKKAQSSADSSAKKPAQNASAKATKTEKKK